MVECLFTNEVVVGSNPVAVTYTSKIALVSSKEFVDIQATVKCGFTLKGVRDMIITYNQNPQCMNTVLQKHEWQLRTVIIKNY